MKITRYFSFILLISAPLCLASSPITVTAVPISTNELLVLAAKDAGIGALAAYATYHIGRTAVVEKELGQCTAHLSEVWNSNEKKTEGALFGGNNKDGYVSRANTWGFQVVRPLAYLSLFATTGRIAVTRAISAYELLKEAYTRETVVLEKPVIIEKNR